MSFSSNAPASTPSTLATAASGAASSMALFNVEVEAGNLAILIQHPDAWADYYLITESDWSKVNRPIFAVLKGQLDSTPPGSVAPLVISEKLKSYGITEIEGFNVYEYLEGLRIRFVQKQDGAAMARELKRLSVRRQLIEQLDGAKRDLVRNSNASFEDMTRTVERGLTAVTTEYYKPEVDEVMGDALISVVEARAENPVDASQMPYLGPFDSINRTIGAMVYPGSLTCVIARTNVGKSAFSFFYCISIAERYGVPILWLDAAEMTVEQIQMRAVCCLSKGIIPLWAVRSGEWRKNPVWVKLIREDLWPRIKKLRLFYKNVGGMTPAQKISFIRRFHYSKVGRDEFLLICDDYLKGVESLSKNSQEYQAMGYYVGDVKTLVTDELNAGYWTSLQGNRSAITQGKKLSEVQDSAEAGASISDRIIQQATVALLMRPKLNEELALEHNLFGNMVLKKAKVREGYGKEYEKLLRPIKAASGAFVENYFHMQGGSFYYEDRGLHSDAMVTLGQQPVDMGLRRGAAPAGL